ncbi:hypothetical protein [Streptomyces candidus]|uniref:Uncharacterized protein n=1 Tax=Streptomyces candidus TaxID=67283 RepID=A0A7X0LT35_9ACTN|nr:hypothetical protein [Streptomyces candidus]MBB6439905.1 hypothetical protein [Streptomyces candidus]GHH57871.1 hypothetical protein GCM10018773_65800 [Streptomyces candidus]
MLRLTARHVQARVGRRGTALMILGTAKVCFGLGYALQPVPDPIGLGLLTRLADIRCWSSVWIICGTVTFGCAWLRVGRDWGGFVAALIPPFVWGGAFLWGALSGEYARGLAFAAWYAIGHVGLILWAASVPEHSVPHAARRERR